MSLISELTTILGFGVAVGKEIVNDITSPDDGIRAMCPEAQERKLAHRKAKAKALEEAKKSEGVADGNKM